MIVVTFFTLLVSLTTLPGQPPVDGTVVTLSETYVSDAACQLRLPAMRQIMDTLTASGIRLLDGAGCLPVADEADSDVPAPTLLASR